METEKRKRQENDEVAGKRAKAAEEDNGGETVPEDEVEEFFAILRRIHVAVKYFEKGKGEHRKLKAKGSRWKPSFEWEDFEGLKGVKEREKEEEEGVEERYAGLDLNMDPVTEGRSV